MIKTFKYRIYPTTDQEVLINKHIGSCRFLYNLALETKLTAYSGTKTNLTYFVLNKQLTALKKDLAWLQEINSQSLQQSLMNLNTAFTRFYKGKANFPVFKNKRSNQSFQCPQSVKIENNKLFIPKFSPIKIVLHRELFGKLKIVTISKTNSGKYFASITVDDKLHYPFQKKIKSSKTIGIDLGIKHFITLSDGIKIDSPKHFKKYESKINFLNKKHSIKKGKATRKKLSILHEKVKNQRSDFLHKTSTMLIKNHDSIAIEDLNVKKLMSGSLSKAIGESGWAMFISMLQYKSMWKGNNILKIGRFDPSSKMCSVCGKINHHLVLTDREWDCDCGEVHDRDINAAINIKNIALNNYISTGRRDKNQKELPTLVGVMTSEFHLGKSTKNSRH